MRSEPALVVEGLRISLRSGTPIVEDVTLELEAGKVLGLVGESGSGKTTLAVSLLGYSRTGVRISAGEVRICGERLTGRKRAELEQLRGRLVSYVPQDPATSLNPSMRVEEHIADRVRDRPAKERELLVRSALEQAQLPASPQFRSRFPHQLSGGQQQRVLIAMAIAGKPRLVVLDEPTTGLDVVVQSRILDQIAALRDEIGLTILYVTHDLAAVAKVADRVAVMYAGRIVEEGPAADVLRRPLHPYTLGLLESVPDHTRPRPLHGIPGVAVGVGEWPAGCAFAPRCAQRTDACEEGVPRLEVAKPSHAVRCLHWQQTPLIEATAATWGAASLPPKALPPLLEIQDLYASHHHRSERVVVADDVAFSVFAGECVSLVGESGSGKTTIARCIVGLHAPDSGAIKLSGRELGQLARERAREDRRRIQIVFQNPYDSLNPKQTVLSAVERPARMLREVSAAEARSEAGKALDGVRLSLRLRNRYPSELSGGERQRVAIARALVAGPELLICDEITSSLDVSVQAAIIDLLTELRAGSGLAMLFITHDLGVVASIADRVLVLNQGRICERGPTSSVLLDPQDAYTQTLVEAVPRLERPSLGAQSVVERTPLRRTTLDDRNHPLPGSEDG